MPYISKNKTFVYLLKYLIMLDLSILSYNALKCLSAIALPLVFGTISIIYPFLSSIGYNIKQVPSNFS